MIKLFRVFMPPEVDKAVLDTLHSGYVTQGPRVKEFEDALSEELGEPNVLTVNSGTTAIQLALRLAGVGHGDEVITTPMTCVATNLPIMAAGAKIVWADVDPLTGLIDRYDVASKITDKTKAIISVDWAGFPVDYFGLGAAASGAGIPLISDAAHSLGASYEGYMVGAGELASFTCFSLQAIKTITTVDGGILTVMSPKQYQRGKLLRWFGIDREGNQLAFRGELDVAEWGYKFHMNDLNASIGLAQLPYLSKNVQAQRDNAAFYSKHIKMEHPVPLGYEYQSSYWLYPILLPRENMQAAFREYLLENGVETSQVHWRNDDHTTFKEFRSFLPGLDAYSSRMMCIPVHSALTEEERSHVVRTVNNF